MINVLPSDLHHFTAAFTAANPLGHLTWYTIREHDISRAALADALDQAGFASTWLLPEITPVDAFRRATSSLETKRVPGADDTSENWLVREVRSDAETVRRHLVREVVDSANRRLDYRQVAVLECHRATGTLTVDLLEMPPSDTTEQFVEQARERYARWSNAYQGRHLRDLVFRLLKVCQPVAVRPSGGVYFVPESAHDGLRQIQTCVAALGSTLWTVPLVDSDDTRTLVADQLREHVDQTATHVIHQLSTCLAQRETVTPAQKHQAIHALQDLQQLADHYTTILDDALVEVHTRLDLARQQCRALVLS